MRGVEVQAIWHKVASFWQESYLARCRRRIKLVDMGGGDNLYIIVKIDKIIEECMAQRFSIQLSSEHLRLVEEYRFAAGLGSRLDAIRQIIHEGTSETPSEEHEYIIKTMRVLRESREKIRKPASAVRRPQLT